MKKVVRNKCEETIALDNLQKHCILGFIDDGVKYFVVQTGMGLWHGISCEAFYFNRIDDKPREISFYAERFESYVFESAKELFDWLTK